MRSCYWRWGGTVSALSAAGSGAGRACAGKARSTGGCARLSAGRRGRACECIASIRGGMTRPQGNSSREKTTPCSLLPRKARRPPLEPLSVLRLPPAAPPGLCRSGAALPPPPPAAASGLGLPSLVGDLLSRDLSSDAAPLLQL